jgi:copper(I)-binding protein
MIFRSLPRWAERERVGVRRVEALLLLGALLVVACGGGDGGLEVTEARMGQPTGPNAAVYFTVSNGGDQPDRLIAASTGVAASVQVHETAMAEDGTMSMHEVDGLDLPAGGTLALEPGGYHLMLIDAERADVGDTVQVTLDWENAGEMTIDVEVVAPGDTMETGG